MKYTSPLVFGLLLTLFFACQSQPPPQNAHENQQTNSSHNGIEVSVDGKRPSANDEKAIASLAESVLSKAIAGVVNEFGEKLNDALEISDQLESSLINPGLNSLDHGKDTELTVYLFRDLPSLKSPQTIEVFIGNSCFIRFSRIPSSTSEPYAIVHHRNLSTNAVQDFQSSYNVENGWQTVSIARTKRVLYFEHE